MFNTQFDSSICLKKKLHYAVTETHVFEKAYTIFSYQLVREPTQAIKVKVIFVSQA